MRLAAQITFMQEQLNAALSQVTILEQMVSGQRDFITKQFAWNTSLSAETEQLSSRLVSANAKAEVVHTAAKVADSLARKAADTATKTMQAAISHQK